MRILDADPASPDLWFGPGLPALLAPLVAVGAPVSVLRLTSVFVLFAAVLLMYVLARERWGPRVGLLAAYAFGLYLPFFNLLSNLHSEVLAVSSSSSACSGWRGTSSEARWSGSRSAVSGSPGWR